ncbi:MAG: tetratricopeptide repeat protein [candidate division WOR-3 bacterium]
MKKVLFIFLAIFILIFGCQATTQTSNKTTQPNQQVSDAIKYFDFGKEYLKNKIYDSAIKNFQKSIEESLDFIEAYNGLGKSFEGKMDYTRAESLYNFMMTKFPSNPEGFVNMGNLYIKLKKYNDAEKFFFDALKIDSTSSKAYYGLAQLYENISPSRKEFNKLSCYEKACNFDPENLVAAYAYAKALIKVEQYQKAVDLLKKISDNHPTFVEPLSNLAEAYLETKQYQKAIETYNRVNQLDSTIVNTYLGLARAYQGLKDYSSAEKNYNKMITLMPYSTVPYLYLGQMYMEIKDYDRAINYLDKALAKSPNDVNALLLIAQAYFLKVDPVKAKKSDENYQEALKILDKSASYFNKIIEMKGKYVKEAQTGLENIEKRKKEIDPTRW